MIAQTIQQQIRAQVSDRVAFRQIGGDKIGVALPLTYGDGDFCEVILKNRGENQWTLSDDGHIIALGMTQDIDLLSNSYKEHYEALAKFYGAEPAEGELRLDATTENLGDAIFTLSQACLEVAKVIDIKPDKERRINSFRKKFASVVESCAKDAELVKSWYDKHRDPEGLYRADYLIASPKKSVESGLLLFGVGTSDKAWRSVATIQHLSLTHVENRYSTLVAYSERMEESPVFGAMRQVATHTLNIDRQKVQLKELIRASL